MVTQSEKAHTFRALHEAATPFIIPNPWDAGSARVLQALGFEALATTSAGFAQSLGRLDGGVTLAEKIEHCRALCRASDLPISADFENGFADSPGAAAANLLRAVDAGIVGASIEDYSGSEIYESAFAADRIAACAEAVRSLPFPFMLTARAENLIRGVDDLDDTIGRLQAYENVGADVLYAPGLKDLEQVRQVVSATNKPINVLATFMPEVSVEELAGAGVRRISIGSALANHAIGATIAAARQMLDSGGFRWVKDMAPRAAVEDLLG